jgi:hypothetical protein
MLKAVNYSPGMPNDMQTMALGGQKDEFIEYFTGLFSGRTQIREQLDIFLANTVGAKTLFPDNLQQWLASLEDSYQELSKRGKDSNQNELDLIKAMQSILRNENPALPKEHPYSIHVLQARESIDIFFGRSNSHQTLSGEQIQHLYFMTPGVMTIGKEHFSTYKAFLENLSQDLASQGAGWEDAKAFIDALLIVLADRPANLAIENPYRPYLYLIQVQIKSMK